MRLVNAANSLPGWDEAQCVAAQMQLTTSSELPFNVVGDGMAVRGAAGTFTAVNKRNNDVKATTGSSTEGKGSKERKEGTKEEHIRREEELKVSKKKKRAPMKHLTSDLMMQLF